MIKIIAGLGNPDEKYADTRHNIGFMVVDMLASELGVSFVDKFNGRLGVCDAFEERVFFLKPMTYMNLSGKSVGGLAGFYKIAPEDIFVIHDEMNLDFNTLRIRHNGSAGGHNGLSSIIGAIGSNMFPRLKMGIGKGGGDSVSHVLGRFTPDEKKLLLEFLLRGKDSVLSALKEGLINSMNVYNR